MAMREITLTQGQVALVDDADYDMLMKGQKWHATYNPPTQSYYAVRTIQEGSKRKTELMHGFLLGVKGRTISADHINHNTLDNQRSNLRLATRSQQKQNSKPYRGGASKYKGVSKKQDGRKKCWAAIIKVDDSRKLIGYFYGELDAALAYDAAARLYFGEFAYCNFPSGADSSA